MYVGAPSDELICYENEDVSVIFCYSARSCPTFSFVFCFSAGHGKLKISNRAVAADIEGCDGYFKAAMFLLSFVIF
jgi:hypothetical protein